MVKETKFFRKQAAKAERMARSASDAEMSERFTNMAKAYRPLALRFYASEAIATSRAFCPQPRRLIKPARLGQAPPEHGGRRAAPDSSIPRQTAAAVIIRFWTRPSISECG